MTSKRTTTSIARIGIVLVVASMLALTACGSSKKDTATTATTEAQPGVTVADAWARQSPAATTMGAAYMTLTSAIDDQLLSASVPTSVAAKTELHETVAATTESTGMDTDTTAMGSETTAMGTDTTMGGSTEMAMRPVSSIDLPAGEAVALKPGGYHIMLIDLVAPLTAGEQITITLTFAEAGTQEVTVTVRVMSDGSPGEQVTTGDVPATSSTADGGIRPFVLVTIVAVTLVSLIALVALLVMQQDGSTVSYTIPAGTGARIASGEKVDIMPSTIELNVGDHLVIRNQDSQSYIIGPLAVRPMETVDHRFDAPGRFVGACALGSEDQLTVVVT